MYPPIFAAIDAHWSAFALLSGDSSAEFNPVRVFAFGEAPENTARPYVTWQVITGSPENYLANRPDIDGYTLQVDVWADDGQAARDVAAAVRDAIEPHAYIVRWGGDSRDPDTRAYRLSFDVSWFVHR